MNGIRISVDGVTGSGGLDVTIPGGAGWTASPALTRWTYTDRTGAHGGITRVTVRDRSRVADGLLAVVLKGGGGAAITLSDTGATRAAVVLGTAGECAAIAWNPPGGRPPALRRRRGDAHLPLTGRRSPGWRPSWSLHDRFTNALLGVGAIGFRVGRHRGGRSAPVAWAAMCPPLLAARP